MKIEIKTAFALALLFALAMPPANCVANAISSYRPLIIALGDSITYGYGLPQPLTQNYAAEYAERVHGLLLDLAVPGYRCADVMKREAARMPPGAAVVILNCGTNDIGGFGFSPAGLPDGHLRVAPATVSQLRRAERSLAAILVKLRQREPHAQIMVLTVRSWQRMTGKEDRHFAADVKEWNSMLHVRGARVVNISDDPRMYQAAYFQADLLHPNLAGNELIASEL